MTVWVHGVFSRDVAAPVEVVVGHDHAPGHVGRGVAVVADGVVVAHVSPGGRVWDVLTLDRTGVGVHQELGAVPAVTAPGVPGSVDAESVAVAGLHPRHVAVEGVEGRLAQRDATLAAVLVEEAEVHGVGALGPHGHVGTVGVQGDAQWVPGPGPRVGKLFGGQRHGGHRCDPIPDGCAEPLHCSVHAPRVPALAHPGPLPCRRRRLARLERAQMRSDEGDPHVR